MAPRTKKDEPASQPLETTNVFLDTEVYRRFGHDLSHPLLQELRAYITEEQLDLHTTDVTLAEVKRQIREHVAESAAEVKKARKLTGKWVRRFPEIVEPIPEFDAEAVSAEAFDVFYRNLVQAFQARCHAAMDVPASEIFKDYFERLPPFSASSSKEFPDAFVVRALDKWCEANGERMYVVTPDKAMTQAVEASKNLLSMANLEALLGAVAVLESPDVVERAERLLKPDKIQLQLRDEIERQVERLIPIYIGDQLAEGEAMEHELTGDVRIGEFDVLASSKDEVRLLLRVSVPLLIHVEFEDRSMAIYDSEDDVFIGAESEVAEVEATPTIRVYVKLQNAKPRIAEVRMTTEEFNFGDEYEHYK